MEQQECKGKIRAIWLTDMVHSIPNTHTLDTNIHKGTV